MSLIRNLWGRKIIRFLVVGSFNTLFDIGLLLAILKITKWSPLLVNCFSVSIAITVSYFLNHKIVFRHKTSYSLKRYLKFFLITGLGVIFIQDLIIYLVTDKIWIISKTKTFYFLGHTAHNETMELLVAKVGAVLIGLVWNFLLYKYVVFRIQQKPESEEDSLSVA